MAWTIQTSKEIESLFLNTNVSLIKAIKVLVSNKGDINGSFKG